MSDLEVRNAKAMREGLENYEQRIQLLETEMLTLRNRVQTLINLVGSLQQTNNLALQEIRGTGPTS